MTGVWGARWSSPDAGPFAARRSNAPLIRWGPTPEPVPLGSEPARTAVSCPSIPGHHASAIPARQTSAIPRTTRSPAVPQVRRATGPGRVNLIGDHTDYNLGLAL